MGDAIGLPGETVGKKQRRVELPIVRTIAVFVRDGKGTQSAGA